MNLVYICTPLSKDKFNLDYISSRLLEDSNSFAFIPPIGQLDSKSKGAALDKLMIEKCHEVWVFGPIGRDCCWEIGYAQGLGKKVKIFIDDTNKYVIEEDWMVTLGRVEVVTHCVVI